MHFIIAAYALVVISKMDYEEDSFCNIFGRDPSVWVSDQEMIIDLFNTCYRNVPLDGSSDERKK